MEKTLTSYDALMDRVIDRTMGNAEKYALRHKLFGTNDVLPMWVADMDIMSPPFITNALQERAAHPIYGYEIMSDSAYRAQMDWLARRHGLHVEREWLVYSPSVVASINLAIAAFTNPGDKVIVQPPIYPPFFKSVAAHHRNTLINPLKRDEEGVYRFDLDDLRQKIDAQTKLLLLCSPHNPVGRVWSQQELQALGEICLEHNIVIFADEIHSDLIFSPHRHTPVAAMKALRDITITAYGPGKTFNLAGLSISTVMMPNAQLRARFETYYKQIHFAEGTTFGHVAFETAYREGDAWVDALMQYLQGNVNLLQEALQGSSLTCKAPEGTYLAWIDAQAWGLGDRALRERFIHEAKLGLSPGISFAKEGSGFMRLNFAVPQSVMRDAAQRLLIL